MNTHIKLGHVLSYIFFILIIVMGIGLIRQHKEINNNNHILRVNRSSAYANKKNTKNYTLKAFRKNYDSTQPQLNKALAQNSANVKKGLNLAFNDCHTNASFHKNENRINSLLGSSMSQKVFGIVQPKNSDSPFSHGQPVSISDHIGACTVSYGKYDIASTNIPMLIEFTFQTPHVIPQVKGDSTKPFTCHVTIMANVKTSNQSIQFEHEYDNINKADNY